MQPVGMVAIVKMALNVEKEAAAQVGVLFYNHQMLIQTTVQELFLQQVEQVELVEIVQIMILMEVTVEMEE